VFAEFSKELGLLFEIGNSFSHKPGIAHGEVPSVSPRRHLYFETSSATRLRIRNWYQLFSVKTEMGDWSDFLKHLGIED